MAHEAIAQALGISRNTLEKHFNHELTTGAFKKRLEALDALHRQAKKGNVAAIKAYTASLPGAIAPTAPKPEKAPKLGKKEQQQQEALTAQIGTEWQDLLPITALPQ